MVQSTPYAERLSLITIDPRRTRQETVTFTANKEGVDTPAGVHESGLFPSHGYSCDQMFKVARFKLGLALRDAGVSTKGLAESAMSSLPNSQASYRHVSNTTSTHLW